MSIPSSRPERRRPRRRIALWAAAGLVAVLALIQLVPYGRDHSDPPVTRAAVFDRPAVRQIVTDSCADCHSNRTRWPWYTNVAPASWLVSSDVSEGRSRLNLSEWDAPQPELEEVVDVISSGEMPPLKYKVMPNHAAARLDDRRRQELIAGFRRLYATQPPAIR